LPAAVKAGSFREDLYFRLNVLTLTVPPLRDRRADILPLAEHLLGALRAAHGRPHAQLGESARRMLAAYAWPGNVRELRNDLEREVIAATLEATHYQISRSAEILGISRKTLLEKRKKYGLR